MPFTRKKAIKTVYKDDDSEQETGDFSDSGSDARISEQSESDEDIEQEYSSDDDLNKRVKPKSKSLKQRPLRKSIFAKELVQKITNQISFNEDENDDFSPTFSIKDLTEEDKLLPSILNLSESDSSDDECPKVSTKEDVQAVISSGHHHDSDNENETSFEYKDVWSSNVQDNSEDIAKKAFLELEQHKTKIEQTKASLQRYSIKDKGTESDVHNLLAMGEEVLPEQQTVKKVYRSRKVKDDSDSEMDDWEEVKEAKTIPQQGIELVVDLPDAIYRKKKEIDVEMMMKRRINSVKKKYQVYMHKVHVLCWLGHGNYVNHIINDQEVLAASLLLVPDKNCYPGERVDLKYVEQITTWYKDKFTLNQDRHENKFRPKAPPLKDILLKQTKTRVAKSKKHMVFVFVSMLRALGLQCRVMINFVTLPIKPPSTELCSLSTKQKDEKKKSNEKSEITTDKKEGNKKGKGKFNAKGKIPQIDGKYDSSSVSEDSDFENIMQIDGNDDLLTSRTRRTKAINEHEKNDVSPPKRPRKNKSSATAQNPNNNSSSLNVKCEVVSPLKRSRSENPVNVEALSISKTLEPVNENVSPPKRTRKNPTSRNVKKSANSNTVEVNNDNLTPLKRSVASTSRANVKTSITSQTPLNVNDKPQQRSRKTPSPINVKNPNIICKSSETTNINIAMQRKIKTAKNNENSHEGTMINKARSSNTTTRRQQKVTNNNTTNVVDNAHTIVQSNSKCRRINVSKAKKGVNSVNKVDQSKINPPTILITNEIDQSSPYFDNDRSVKKSNLLRTRSHTVNPSTSRNANRKDAKLELDKTKTRTKSAPAMKTSKYFNNDDVSADNQKTVKRKTRSKKESAEDKLRVSHRALVKTKSNNDVTGDLVDIIKNRIKEAKAESRKGIVKDKIKVYSDEDSDYLPEEKLKSRKSESSDDFESTNINPKPSTSRRIDRRVLSPDDKPSKKTDVWCEVYVEELEQWVAVDVVRGKVHCTNDLYYDATHPICYIVGWDNNDYLKDLTRRYVPHWNTVTRKQRVEPDWWRTSIQPWTGPRTARDREEDEYLDKMQSEAPLPKSIAEFKNHPLYALKRHLLKFEVIYPPDATTLGFIRGEPVYARDCVHVCRSRDSWLKEAKVVRLGEKPYKVVKARPKWDRLSNKMITDKTLEIFGPWQVQDYEPPVAENGLVPRNAYGNVELFKDCMLPKGTVHIKLPGLNKVARKLNIDCAPAMTGFDFNGGWSHPVYDGFVVCKEFEEIITDAWVKDQEEQIRKEREKIEARVYGNWKKLIKGLLIRERLKAKYGFEEPDTSKEGKTSKGPRHVAKKKNLK